MSATELPTADRVAMYLGTGLFLLGTVGIGLLEMIAGSTHPVTGEGQIVHEALVPLHIRSYLILLGFLVWGLFAVYKIATGGPGRVSPGQQEAVGASQSD